MKILVLNGGSSGLKAQLRDVITGPIASPPPAPLWKAHIDWGRHPGIAEVRIRTSSGPEQNRSLEISRPTDVLGPVLESIWTGADAVIAGSAGIDVVGHRIVHGGTAFRKTTRITSKVQQEILRLAEFAPEHNRLQAEAIQATEHLLGPDVPQIAVFDTTFHATIPQPAIIYPGPYEWIAQNIQRFGFHGISHQYTSRRAAEILGRDIGELKIITCHLGNGCSLAAIDGGKCIDTTMGFTPLEGLMMGTRSGTIDPGILIYLLRKHRYSADDLDRILNKESGLKGLSGVSPDMRKLTEALDNGNQRARLAVDVYVHRLRRELGGMVASLNGVDVVVFTGGVGENSSLIRQRASEHLAYLGVQLDVGKNAASPVDEDIATPDSRVRVLVIRTEEDVEIANECWRCIASPRQ